MGHGLGLYLSAQIAKSLGGKLEVKSRLHEGSTFTLSLDLETVNPENEQIQAYINNPEPKKKSKKVRKRSRLEKISEEVDESDSDDKDQGQFCDSVNSVD